MRGAAEPLEPGHIVSIEPGYYVPGTGGIRLENLVQVVSAPCGPNDTPETAYLQFEPLTFVPFDVRLIRQDLMTADELQWLDAYHQQVQTNLKPCLSRSDRTWLEARCAFGS